jgi:CRP/FNR family cyclic AMP-dependent transcriptional regulator
MTSTDRSSLAERTSALADHPFLSALPAEALRRLAAHTYPHSYARGDIIFREGDVADRFFLVRDGSVTLTMDVPGRGSVAMETLDADCALGWSWLFEPVTRQL